MPAPVPSFAGFRERRHLHEIEVVEQADPHHARQDVQPASDPEL